MGKFKEMSLDLQRFEELGKILLKHKYLYYIKTEPEISDYDYDMLERDYVKLAKSLKEQGADEPEVHMLLEDLWKEDVEWWPTPASKIDFPSTHPWADKIIEENQ